MADQSKKVGIVGAGRFGIALTNLVSRHRETRLYSRRASAVYSINKDHHLNGVKFNERVQATDSLEQLCAECKLILPVTPSVHFREVIREMSPYLTPEHILIHGTKGFDKLPGEEDSADAYQNFKRSQILTMSEVIRNESDVIRVGALCGPNLAAEIIEGLPTATVIASEFDEVIEAGSKALSGRNFFVFGSHDLRAAELTGALKNVIALASGMIGGRQLGKNCEAMLLIRGFREMILLGDLLGANTRGFFGTAGLGDLIATATSNKSRNYTCGARISNGEKIQDILSSSDEVIEGIRTLRVVNFLIQKFKVPAPIISMIHKIIFEDRDIESGIMALMRVPLTEDVDFV